MNVYNVLAGSEHYTIRNKSKKKFQLIEILTKKRMAICNLIPILVLFILLSTEKILGSFLKPLILYNLHNSL